MSKKQHSDDTIRVLKAALRTKLGVSGGKSAKKKPKRQEREEEQEDDPPARKAKTERYGYADLGEMK